MPKTATPRKPESLERRLAETRNTSRNRSLAALLGIEDRNPLKDMLSATNDVVGRGTIAGFLGLPGDLGGMAENGVRYALGMPQVTPYGGSEHIGQQMEKAGLVTAKRRPVAETLASLISPSAAATAVFKAPAAARAGVRLLDNLADSRGMGRGLANSQVGAIENLWHGSPNEFDAFDIGRSGETTDGGLLGRGVYLSTDRNVVRDGQNAYMVQADVSNPLRISLPNFKTDKKSVVTKALGLDESATPDEIASAARANGFDSVELDYGPTGYAHKEYAIFDADKTNILERNGQPVGNLGKMVAPQDDFDVIRYDAEGDIPTFDKPHGIYTTPAGVASPHTGVGGNVSKWKLNPEAKVLDIEIDDGPSLAMRPGAKGAGGGVATVRHFLGQDTFNTIKGLNKYQLVDWIGKNTDFDPATFSNYYDSQEVMEGLGGLLARKNGYSAISYADRTPFWSSPEWDERILLSEDAVIRNGQPVRK